MDRRLGDRRGRETSILVELDPGIERRRTHRRRLVRAGMLALLGAAGAKAHVLTRVHLLTDPAQVSVDVSENGFRLQDRAQEYDRAMLETFANEAAEVYGVSANLVLAVIQTESGFDADAVSRVGAQGPMQLMPSTAESLGIDDPQDARQNIFGGTRYLGKLLDRFNGNVALALASYNAGPTVVARHKGIPPYGETRGYVRRIHNLLADTDAAFSMPTPQARAKGRAVLKSRTTLVRAGLKDRRARVSRAVSVSRKPVRSTKAKAVAVKYKAPVRRARASGALA
jgi:hypothetical protein